MSESENDLDSLLKIVVLIGSLFFVVAFMISFDWVLDFRKEFLKEYESFLEQMDE